MNESREGRDMSTSMLRYLNERLAAVLQEEITRGDGAERKAIQLISVSGAGAAIVAAVAISIFKGNGSNDVATVLFVIAVAIQLTKSALFSLMAIRPGRAFYEDPVALVKERKGQDYAAALQADIELMLWLYGKTIPVNTRKLFYVDRAVRNFAGAAVVALLAAILPLLISLLTDTGPPARQIMCEVSICVGFLTVLLALASDQLIERFDHTWTSGIN